MHSVSVLVWVRTNCGYCLLVYANLLLHFITWQGAYLSVKRSISILVRKYKLILILFFIHSLISIMNNNFLHWFNISVFLINISCNKSLCLIISTNFLTFFCLFFQFVLLFFLFYLCIYTAFTQMHCLPRNNFWYILCNLICDFNRAEFRQKQQILFEEIHFRHQKVINKVLCWN